MPRKRKTEEDRWNEKEDRRIAAEVKPGQKMARPLPVEPPQPDPERRRAPKRDQPDGYPEYDYAIMRAALMALPLSKRIPAIRAQIALLDRQSKVALASILLDETDHVKE